MRPHPSRRTSRVDRQPLRRCRWLPILLVALVAGAARASDESDHWAPSFALFFDALGQKASGSLTTGPVQGSPLSPYDGDLDAVGPPGSVGTGCLRRFGISPNFTYRRSGDLCASARKDFRKIFADDADTDTSVSPLVGASLELMTPSLLDGFLRPRLFVHGDVAKAFSFERNLAGTEHPGEFAPPKQTVFSSDNPEELAVQGQGSRTRLQVKPLVLSGGAGIALETSLFGRRVRIKPSFEYLREQFDLIGVVHRAVKLREFGGAADLSGFRLLSLTAKEEKTYDGYGPGLELEIDAARLGPFVSSVFILARGYYIFGDLETTTTTTNESGETATWTWEPENWAWRGGVGFRLRWLPEPG